MYPLASMGPPTRTSPVTPALTHLDLPVDDDDEFVSHLALLDEYGASRLLLRPCELRDQPQLLLRKAHEEGNMGEVLVENVMTVHGRLR
jgi:hypothetical protein